MTRSGTGTNDLAVIVRGQQSLWMPPFILCVIGNRRIFEALAPAVGPDGHIEPGAHFWRTVSPFITGYLNPGDGSYARNLRRAHGRAAVPRTLLTAATNWNVTIMCRIATMRGHQALVPSLVKAGKRIAVDFGADPNGVDFQPLKLRSRFQKVIVAPEQSGAIWPVLSWPKIDAALGHPTNDEEILKICRQFLPRSFVNQFRRS